MTLKPIYLYIISDKLCKHCTSISPGGTLSNYSDDCATNKIYFGAFWETKTCHWDSHDKLLSILADWVEGVSKSGNKLEKGKPWMLALNYL